jgi:hypothetical protein
MLAEASPDVRIWHLTCGFVRAAVSDRRGPALLLRPARTGRQRLAAGVCANYVPKFGGPPTPRARLRVLALPSAEEQPDSAHLRLRHR